ncbi:MAG TPA: hypothetical protein DCE07_08895 [Peptococcaceae bacterium]|nr:hypothetical protein [Peptococcaceae bacterium]
MDGFVDERGFTFVEVIVAMTILAFVVTIVSLLYVSGYRNYGREEQRIEVQENLRIAVKKMSQKIRQADPESITIDPDNADSITFFVPSEGESGYRFDDADGEIEECIGDDQWLPIASYITYLRFEYDEVEKTVTITVRGKKGESGPVELSTKIYLRVSHMG